MFVVLLTLLIGSDMAHFLLIIGAAVLSSSNALKTCPGRTNICLCIDVIIYV